MFENHPNSKIVFDYYEKSYFAGALGIWLNYCVASTYLKSERYILSSMVIGDKGTFKSTVMNDTLKTYPQQTWRVPDQPTDRGLIREFNEHKSKANNKMWAIDDSVTCFPSLEMSRQNRVISYFVKMLDGGNYKFSDFSNTSFSEGKIGLVMNIATSNFKEIFKILSQSTFLDRVVPFRFDIDHRKQIIVTTKFRNGFKSVPPKIKIKRDVLTLNKNTYEEIDYIISVIDQETSMSKSRANNYVVLALKSIALFEGRNKVELCDIKLFKDLFLKHITTREVRTRMVDVMLQYLTLTPNGSMEGFISYLESPESKAMYPLENELFLKDGLQKAKGAWSKAVEIKNRDKGIREIIEGIRELKEGDINVI